MRSFVFGIAALVACNHAPGGEPSDATMSAGDAMSSSSSDAAMQSAACGTRTDRRGKTSRSVMVGGANRTYEVYLPASADPATPMPLVYVFHGYTMSGDEMVSLTDYTAIADADNVAVVFPDGEGGPDSLGAPWNVGSDVCPAVGGISPALAYGDDMDFIDAMRADVATDQCIDADHVFATGFSMGGYMAHHVGCERTDFRAVAPHSGGTHDLTACPSVHKPIIIFHGTSDETVPDACDDPSVAQIAGYPASATQWAAHNGCATTFTTTTVENGTCIVYDNCPADGQVELCTFTNMLHCWAGGTGTFGCPTYQSATQLEWAFFKQYAW
ncbi:MAG TPA: PHB depolymerase family esterase [Kofleriaceae bacterium]|nr:PHB depolymerase family esterase [Kofleriaceae bacterium]